MLLYGALLHQSLGVVKGIILCQFVFLEIVLLDKCPDNTFS